MSSPYFDVDAPVGCNKVIVRASATSKPTVSSGTGVPATTEPNGSMFLRTDATNGDDAIYMRVAGAWVAILGQTA
jgi:ribosomal protein L2